MHSLIHLSVRETADGILPWTFEVRVVHGTDEVHGVVAKCAAKYTVKITKNNNSYWKLFFMIYFY